jgi:hypothetical protein
MATTKQPKFPHPPLEQGVAQYPTPAIPDFITQSGHIILVEKVSAEKGSYTPKQPAVTDTNPVIYTGRDAKKWPSNLYLVHERPNETGEFVYRYWANDRSLSSQDPWNYGISYDGGDPFYPTYTREYIVPRSQYTAVPVGGQDPLFGSGQGVTLNVSGTTATITGTNFSYAKGANIYVYTQSTTTQTTQQKYALGSFTLLTASSTTLTYAVQSGATNPSVPIFINPTVISEQEMSPLGDDNPLRSRYVKVKRVYEPIPSTVLTTNTNKAGLMGSTAKSDQLVTAATNPNELSLNLSGESILQSSVEHVSANKSNFTNIITDGPYSLSGDSLNKFGTTETITESIVAAGTTADKSGALLLSDDITPIDVTKSQRKQVVLDSVPPSLVTYESTQDNSVVQNVTSYLSRNISSGLGAFVPPITPASQVVYSPTAATSSNAGSSGYATFTFSSLPSIKVGDLVSMSGVFASGWGLPNVNATGVLNGYATLTFATLSSTDVVVGDQIRISGQTSNGWASGIYTATAVYLSTKVVVLSLPVTGASSVAGYAANTSTKYAVTAIDSTNFIITLSLPVVNDAITASGFTITQNNNRLLQTSDSDIGFPWVRRISKYLPTAYTSVNGYVQLPPSRVEYKTAQFSFPGLIYTWGETSSGTSATFTYPQNRLPLDITCTQKHVYSYYDYQPNVSALKFFKVVTQPWAIKFFGIPKNTIHPSAPISFKNDSSTDNGVTYGIFGGQASTPSIYKIGQQILIGADVQLWQGGIYVQRLIYTQEPLS